jgi:hypothetical protein
MQRKIPKGSSIGQMTVLQYQSATGVELPGRVFTDPIWVIFDKDGDIFGVSNEYLHETDNYFTDESSLA